jgi:hypothetical protein
VPPRVTYNDLPSLLGRVLTIPEDVDLFLILGEKDDTEVRRLPFVDRMVMLAAFGAPFLHVDSVDLKTSESVVALMTHSLVWLSVFGAFDIKPDDKDEIASWFNGFKAPIFINLLDSFFRSYGLKVIR